MSERKKILVVDDNSANLTVINGILSSQYKVYPVDSAEIALKFVEKQCPDLILLDVEMPVMDGIELFGILKNDERLSGVPIIFLTANNDMRNEASAFQLGISDYIRKPVNDIILQARVSLHLELTSLRKERQNDSTAK